MIERTPFELHQRLVLNFTIQEAATFIFIAAVAIYCHIPTEGVFCIFFLSAPESAEFILPISNCSLRLEWKKFQLLPRPFGLGDDSGRRASSSGPFANIAILPYACSSVQAF